MANKRDKNAAQRKRALIYPPGLDSVLIEEAESFMAKRGERIPAALNRRLPYLVRLVRDPGLLLHHEVPAMREDRSLFAKAYARNPEIFLELMLHLTRFHLRMGPIMRALRENGVITFRHSRRLIRKPINKATPDELVAFIRYRYGEFVEPKAVARSRQRLAHIDARRSHDPIMRKALEIFAEQLCARES